ncbi:hypothetical protein SAMN05216345_104152 [Cupriavidus sp. YR651]|uniref:hypothetical protein n=1 Tax=Cupriavidus sp. YR651 TaxID=1855315 RepID=UPI00088F530F|nr:hypothetical protein [Cupriavidus sp. YR651]SDC84932.1 hypothetical protein SAMN05216345_104152 [Cupriavidus sp. YR651]
MSIFLGYFIWGLILAAPLAWLTWRFHLLRWLPRWSAPRPRRAVRLPPQLEAVVIRGKRLHDGGRR